MNTVWPSAPQSPWCRGQSLTVTSCAVPVAVEKNRIRCGSTKRASFDPSDDKLQFTHLFRRAAPTGWSLGGPPLYTNNKLTPAEGFRVPAEARSQFDIAPFSVGTDPNMTLKTRRGTGYYKVPSLKGVWYRSMFGHSGWCASLEDWFDPRRTEDDYEPTGFKPYGTKSFPVKGHPFGLDLSEEGRRALIAFLNTL